MTSSTTLPELFFHRVAESGDAIALMNKQNGTWIHRSWNQLAIEVRETARGISDWVAPGDIVCILAENRPEWWVADLAILGLGAASAPIYATSPPGDIAYILGDCGATLLFVSSAEQLGKIRALRQEGRAGGLQRVITMDPVPSDEDWVLSFKEVRQRNVGAADPLPERMAALSSEDLATLIYTSGTTGEPKGVRLTHRSLLSNTRSFVPIVEAMGLEERVMLSFLPLAHCLERVIGIYVAITCDFSVAFAEGVQQLIDNLAEVRPTLLIGVPRIFEKVHGRVMQSASGGLKGRLMGWALAVGKARAERLRANRPVPPLDRMRYAVAHRLVFSKLHARLGGRLRHAVSGGAPLAPAVIEFFAAAGLTIFEGYGMTEASLMISANIPGKLKIGSVGVAWPDVQIRIAPDPERYGPESESGDGEICIKGPSVMEGYHNNPGATAEAFDTDGWLHTGDIGHLDEEGFLFITDRKKELLKTAGGKYVAPQPIENGLKLHPLVEQAVLIGDRRKYCVALIVPAFEALEEALERPADRAALNDDPQVRALFQEAVDRVNESLGSWARIKRFHLLPSDLSQESGDLTPTLKVRRRVVEQKFAAIIDAMYTPG